MSNCNVIPLKLVVTGKEKHIIDTEKFEIKKVQIKGEKARFVIEDKNVALNVDTEALRSEIERTFREIPNVKTYKINQGILLPQCAVYLSDIEVEAVSSEVWDYDWDYDFRNKLTRIITDIIKKNTPTFYVILKGQLTPRK